MRADYKDDIAFSRLATELGLNLPDGGSVIITQVEAAASYVDDDNNSSTDELPVYLPDQSAASFSNDFILDMTDLESGTFSGHAASVGSILYGNNSIASGANIIHAYWADDWFQSGLNHGSSNKPFFSSSRLANHSWIGTVSSLTIASKLLKRIDWLIATDEFIQIVGVKNSVSTNASLFAAAYNVLAVGKTDGNHSTGSPLIDAAYPEGRSKTEIVAPFTTSSAATPAVAATAALLINVGHSTPWLSTDTTETSINNRNNDTIYNAERSEVIKAALLAGADRLTKNTSTTANITDYRVSVSNQTDNGLDARFGAGQVNVYHSYHIITGGEQNSSQDGGAGSTVINTFGFDYDPAFGGANGSNNVASYYFSSGVDPKILSASLVWHIDIDSGNGNGFSGEATFYDLDLYLYDVTGAQTLLVNSTSQIDNSENIWTSLNADRNYLLQVIPKNGQNAFDWDYALAWQLLPDLDGDGVVDDQDNCPVNSNADQADLDEDGIGNDCDYDDDNDGVDDDIDAFPFDSDETLDSDDDGIGNNADTDDDNDGVDDNIDAFPFDPDETLDSDNDGIGNNADIDDDNDGVDDDIDVFPFDPEEALDSDDDGIGNNADTDDDNDGVPDQDDGFPLDSTRSSVEIELSESAGGAIGLLPGLVLVCLLGFSRRMARY